MRFASSAIAATVVVMCGLSSVTAKAQILPGFVDERFAAGLTRPTAMAFAPDGRLFITEQDGSVRVVKGGVLRSSPFLRLDVDPRGERGLLGIAFDPDFASNRFVYFYYTVPGNPPHNRITQFTANGDVAQPGSAKVILNLESLSSHTNHNGGAIHFGRDGKLYVAVGENAKSANAQLLSNRLGKMLRINRDGSIPADNPTSFQGISGSTSGVNRAIWAVGLRNPFTFSIQPGSGAMMINDVGENTFEEVNRGLRGRNYGWPIIEGPSSNPKFTGPLFAYRHSGGTPAGCAITGGTFYNPTHANFPASYVGMYFFADYCRDWIYYLNPSSPGVPTLFRSGLSQPVDIAVGPDGALYYLQRGDGHVGRIRYSGRTSQGIVVSANQLEIGEGSRAVLSVRLAKRPPENKAVMFERLMSDPSITGFPTSMTFTPSNWDTARLFTVSAAHDGDNIDEAATFVLSSSGTPSVRVWVKAVDKDRPAGFPQANITLPRNADSVSGRQAEFFGDGRGNVVRAEFLVDGILRYTDVNSSGHYHFGGDHNLWNTEMLSNGQHLVTMRVVDDQGRSGSHSVLVTVNN